MPPMLDIETLRSAYAAKRLTPLDVADLVIERRAASRDPAIFISIIPDEALRQAARSLMDEHPSPNALPLWGIPYAVKDNIDAAGMATTAGCPAFAYDAVADATAVARLEAAGALLVGKTNLDQFATGLNGTRSPYGAPRSVFDADYVSGGSSSGSAVAVASGLASFSLGTDTAGSGRVPAMLNNLVGIKPTLGIVPTTGVVPACRSLDCVSVFALSVGDGVRVRRVVEGPDPADAFSRPAMPRTLPTAGLRVGILSADEREFFGDTGMSALYERAIEAARSTGAAIVEIDYGPFREAAALLYEGPWVAERLAALGAFLATNAADFEPTVRTIVEGAGRFNAVDAFRGQYALAALRRRAEVEWARADILLLPTAPTTYTVARMIADPIALNARLGRYTNFVNLLDCAAIAIPAGFDSAGHLPGGVTLVGPAFSDDSLAAVADRLHRGLAVGMGADCGTALPAPRLHEPEPTGIEIAVVGAHLTGMPLNPELTEQGGRLVRVARTTKDYRLYVLPDTSPAKPGLVRDPGRGGEIEVEVWRLPAEAFGRFVAAIPAPLGIGKLVLTDGSAVPGFLCETYAVREAQEITTLGGWRAFTGGAS